MKKSFRIVMSCFILLIVVTFLTGCGMNTTLGQLERTVTLANRTTEQFDNVASEDLSSNLLKAYSLEGNTQPRYLSNQTSSTGDSVDTDVSRREKIGLIIESHQQIREKQQHLSTVKADLKIAFVDLKANIADFKNSGQQLTDEEKQMIKDYMLEIKEINSTVKGTIGNVYKKMADLRGKYNLSNIDLVNSTLQDCNNTMTIRVNSVDRLYEIVTELNNWFENK